MNKFLVRKLIFNLFLVYKINFYLINFFNVYL